MLIDSFDFVNGERTALRRVALLLFMSKRKSNNSVFVAKIKPPYPSTKRMRIIPQQW